MENLAPENDPKHYVDAVSGQRPDIFVVFLNIERQAGVDCNGLLIPVTEASLAELDRRELNYGRVDVSDDVAGSDGHPVWAYVATRAARRRFERASREGSAVASADYVRLIHNGFAALGRGAVAAQERSTEALATPVRDLRLVRRCDA